MLSKLTRTTSTAPPGNAWMFAALWYLALGIISALIFGVVLLLGTALTGGL